MLVEYDLNVIQGSTFGALLTATDETGTAIDLGSYQLRGSIKSKYSDSSSIADLDLQKVPDGNTNPLTHTGGKINVNLKTLRTTGSARAPETHNSPTP